MFIFVIFILLFLILFRKLKKKRKNICLLSSTLYYWSLLSVSGCSLRAGVGFSFFESFFLALSEPESCFVFVFFIFGRISRSWSYPYRGEWELCMLISLCDIILIDLVEVSWVLFSFFFFFWFRYEHVLGWNDLHVGFELSLVHFGSRLLDLSRMFELIMSCLVLCHLPIDLIEFLSLVLLHFGVSWRSISVNAFPVVDLRTGIVLSPESWSIGLLIDGYSL